MMRMRMMPRGRHLAGLIVIEDPTMYAEVWTAAIPMTKIEGPLFEYACHEGNHALPNMLRGARADEHDARQD